MPLRQIKKILANDCSRLFAAAATLPAASMQHHHISAYSSPSPPPHSPGQIKEKLLQALDRDYHVVDMALALEAVSLLERTTVTKEALETTRLGRLVNEMRKKTNNDNLARRAKDLVRRWRDMVSKPLENGTGGTGQGPGIIQGTPALSNNHLKGVNSVSSPALYEMGRMSSPALSRSHTASLGLHPSSPAFRGVMTSLSPALSHHQPNQRNNNKSAVQHRISPTFSVASESSTSPGLSFSLSQTHSNSSRPSTPSSLVVKSKALSPGPGRPVVVELNSKELGRTDHRGFKRARDNDEETMTGFDLTGKRSRTSNGAGDWPWPDECSRDSNMSWSGDSIRMGSQTAAAIAAEDRSLSSSSRANVRSGARIKGEAGDVLKEKFASIARVSKVKTTQELLDDLARRSGSPNLMAARSEPVHPHDTKHDVIAKFFQSQTEASANTTTAAASIVPKVERRHFAKPVSDSKDPVAEIYARLPPLDPAAIASLWSAETEQQPAEDDEAPTSESPPPARPPVSEEEVHLLHTTELDCVNGTRDYRNDFHEWHETSTVNSFGGDPLHLLPYVVID